MQVVTPELISDKKVLLRYDIDVALKNGEVSEDFKLRAGLNTLKLCLDNSSKVILMGHVGRPPAPVYTPEFSAKPILIWMEENLGQKIDFAQTLEEADKSNQRLVLLENIRFFPGEEENSQDFAQRLASLGNVYVNEAFSSYRPAVSTTVVPALLPNAAGIHFMEEVRILTQIKNNPKSPFVAIMGGAKISEKIAVINILAQKADAVLVGGKLVAEIREQNLSLPKNVLVGKLTEDGFDIASETVLAWEKLIMGAAEIVWNGPVGRIEDPNLGSAKGTHEIAKMILESKGESVVGGGDTVGFLGQVGLLKEFEEKGFVSVGGGAMLKFLTDGTLPTIEALS